MAFKNEIKSLAIDLARPKKLALVAAGLSLSYLGYKTVEIFLNRRKYRHIPGPPTKGLLGFFIGNLVEFTQAMSDGKLIDDVFFEWLFYFHFLQKSIN